MFRKVLALGLFASLLLSGMFLSPVYKAEESEEFYEDQPYLYYDLHIHELNSKYYDEGDYPDFSGSVYMRREYSSEESEKFRELLNIGFVDVYRIKNKKKQEYTFWDYFAGSWQKNYGMRIDHFLMSNNLIENISSIKINKKPRSKTKPSDHTPIEIEIS